MMKRMMMTALTSALLCFAREDLRREEWQKNLERRLRRHRPRKSKNPGMSGASNLVLQ